MKKYTLEEIMDAFEECEKQRQELEQENKQLKEQLENKIDLYEDTISYQLGFDKGKEYLKQEILEFINNLRGQDRNEFLGYGGDVILEILGDKE